MGRDGGELDTAVHMASESPLDPPPIVTMALPDFVGSYKVVRELGRGGMGVVYLAEQQEPVTRRLAVKRIHRHLADPTVWARFEAERKAMARLSHPNIAQIYEAAATDDGVPYLAMEYVDGSEPVTEYCDRARLTIEQRLRLFVEICRGMQHAHQRGIIHRDLKPSNVLVQDGAGRPMVKIIDFGLAKALDQPLTGDRHLTQGYVVGTPEYMSPESFDGFGGDAVDVDTRNDVYSLGVILYEMLCGLLPMETSGKHILAFIQALSEGDPPSPSRRLSTCPETDQEAIAEERALQPATLKRRLSDELDLIVMKAMAREREDRYSSVENLADDIERHLRQEPIEAHPGSRVYRVRKLVRRHRVVAGFLGALLLTLFFGVLGTSVGMLRANQESEAARRAQNQYEELAVFLEELFQSGEPGHPAREMTTLQLLASGAERVGQGFADQPETKARILRTIGNVYLHLALLDEAEAMLQTGLDLYEPLLADGSASSDRNIAYGETLQSLGRLRLGQDRHQEALDLVTRASARFEQEKAWPQIASAQDHQAAIYLAMSDLERAAELTYQSLQLKEEIHGPRHPASIVGLNRLAHLAILKDRWTEAEAYALRTFGIVEEHFGENDLRRTQPLRHLARIYFHTDRRAKTVEILQQVLELRLRAYGGPHPAIGQSYADLAHAYVSVRKTAEAEANYQTAVAVFEAAGGEASMGLAMVLNNQASLYWRLEDYARAEPIYRRALEMMEKLLGPDHTKLAATVNNIGLIHWERGELDQAEAQLQRAHDIWQEKLGPTSRRLAWPLWGLAGVRRDQGRLDEADALYRRALEIRSVISSESDALLQDIRRDQEELQRARERLASGR